jgi:hypothetical protein
VLVDLICKFLPCRASGDSFVSVGDVSINVKEPQHPELVPVKYSKYAL